VGAKVLRIDRAYPAHPSGGAIVLKGRITSFNGPNEVWIDYNLGRYYIPEAREEESLSFGEASRKGNVLVEIAVRPDGTGIVKSISVNGSRLTY
jgi:uncharacterized membrane-anchored protein